MVRTENNVAGDINCIEIQKTISKGSVVIRIDTCLRDCTPSCVRTGSLNKQSIKCARNIALLVKPELASCFLSSEYTVQAVQLVIYHSKLV